MSVNAPKNRPKRSFMPVLAGLSGLTLAACATPVGAHNVSGCAAGGVSQVDQATVTSYRVVSIQGNDNGIGAITGAALGGLAGSQVGGRNSTQAIGAIGGAVIGGVAGNAVGNAVTRSNGLAYLVRFNTGETVEIVQAGADPIAPGSPVNVVQRCDGTYISRL